ncbi:MAG: protein phosphatase 2C domain-containing protein, partial [Anaerovoracaceae bacterium]
MIIKSGYASDKGMKRKCNEDAFFVMPLEDVYIVADGVGGSNAGEIASRMAVTGIAEYVKRNPILAVEDEKGLAPYFKLCIETVNRKIFDFAGRNPGNEGMATTIVLCHVRGNKMFLVNIGDSRAYILKGEELIQVTEDHTYVNSLIKMGVITEDEARSHEKGHMITRALGADKYAEPDFTQIEIEKGDKMILCSDGLYADASIERVKRMTMMESDMPTLAIRLVEMANKA